MNNNKFKQFFCNTGDWFKSLFTVQNGQEPKLLTLYKKPGTKSIISSLLCILAGVLVGFIVMLIIAAASPTITAADAFRGLGIILGGPFSSGTAKYISMNFGDMIFYAGPLIMTGLSVAIAFKTGLFNIGAPGQYYMGAMGSLLVALSIPSKNGAESFFIWLFAVVGMAFGALWGAIPGLFRAFFNVNEVIVCIMTNWISANIVTWVFSSMPQLVNTGMGKSGYLITTAVTGNGTPKIGLDKIFPGSYIDLGIVIAIVFAIVLVIMLNKTTFGYELKACGNNRYASKYAGMSEKRNVVLSMVIAGGIAGVGGALYYLNPGIEFQFLSAYSKLPDYGFNGIPVALLASSNPIGIIFTGIFLRYIAQGGNELTSAGYNRYIADIIIALIIYFAGFSKLIMDILSRRQKKLSAKVQLKIDEKAKTIDMKDEYVLERESSETLAESIENAIEETNDASPVNTQKKEVDPQ
jgi:ABC-type uncharacterized transport system permease subunit